MRHYLEAVAVLVGATLLEALWGTTPHAFHDLFNFFAIAVVYLALRWGEKGGAIGGTICGLAQDALTLRVLGLAGLTKTILGFSIGLAFRKLDIHPFGRQTLVLFFGAFLELLIWASLAYIIFSLKPPVWSGTFWLQPLSTALIGGTIYQLRQKWLNK